MTDSLLTVTVTVRVRRRKDGAGIEAVGWTDLDGEAVVMDRAGRHLLAAVAPIAEQARDAVLRVLTVPPTTEAAS